MTAPVSIYAPGSVAPSGQATLPIAAIPTPAGNYQQVVTIYDNNGAPIAFGQTTINNTASNPIPANTRGMDPTFDAVGVANVASTALGVIPSDQLGKPQDHMATLQSGGTRHAMGAVFARRNVLNTLLLTLDSTTIGTSWQYSNPLPVTDFNELLLVLSLSLYTASANTVGALQVALQINDGVNTGNAGWTDLPGFPQSFQMPTTTSGPLAIGAFWCVGTTNFSDVIRVGVQAPGNWTATVGANHPTLDVRLKAKG